MAQRKAVTKQMARRYSKASKAEKGRMLDELCALTGWTRRHARRSLRLDCDNGSEFINMHLYRYCTERMVHADGSRLIRGNQQKRDGVALAEHERAVFSGRPSVDGDKAPRTPARAGDSEQSPSSHAERDVVRTDDR